MFSSESERREGRRMEGRRVLGIQHEELIEFPSKVGPACLPACSRQERAEGKETVVFLLCRIRELYNEMCIISRRRAEH